MSAFAIVFEAASLFHSHSNAERGTSAAEKVLRSRVPTAHRAPILGGVVGMCKDPAEMDKHVRRQDVLEELLAVLRLLTDGSQQLVVALAQQMALKDVDVPMSYHVACNVSGRHERLKSLDHHGSEGPELASHVRRTVTSSEANRSHAQRPTSQRATRIGWRPMESALPA